MELRGLLSDGMERIREFLSTSPASRSEMRRRQALRISVEDKKHQAALLREASMDAETDEDAKRLSDLGDEREQQAEEMAQSLERHLVNREASVHRRLAQHDEARRRSSGEQGSPNGGGE